MNIPSSPFFLHLRVAPVMIFLLMAGGGPPLLPAGEDFFQQGEIHFWEKPLTAAALADPASLFPEAKNMPAPVKTLVADPTVENAFTYMAWQQERVRRITRAVQALEKARNTPLLFTRPDCPHCHEQEAILESLDLHPRRIDPLKNPVIARRFDITAVPTLVLSGRVLRGVTPAEKIRTLLEPRP